MTMMYIAIVLYVVGAMQTYMIHMVITEDYELGCITASKVGDVVVILLWPIVTLFQFAFKLATRQII